jgi:DNA-binding MarR family transcriptional regulator
MFTFKSKRERVSTKVSELYKKGKPQQNLMDILDKRQRWAMNYILQKGSVRAKDIANYFKVDDKTARIWIKSWIAEDFIKKKDLIQQRNIEYILTEKFLTEI